MKYFLAISDIDQIIELISISKKDFIINDALSLKLQNEIALQHKKIKTYQVFISKDKNFDGNFSHLIKANHTDPNGSIMFVDFFEKKNETWTWLYRNTSSFKKTDEYVLKEKDEEIEKLKAAGRALVEENKNLKCIEIKSKHSNDEYEVLLRKYNDLKQKYENLQKNRGRKEKFTQEEKEEIYNLKKMGLSVTKIAEKYKTTRKTIYNVLDQMKISQ